MNQSRKLLNPLKLASNFLTKTQLSKTHSFHDHANHFPTSKIQSFPPKISHFDAKFFSSNPQHTLGLVLDNDWSRFLEGKLSENFEVTHESVLYVLKNLDKDPERAGRFYKWVTAKNGFVPSGAVYELMLRIFANEEYIKQFWVVANEMKERFFFITDETYETVLKLFKGFKTQNEAAAWTRFRNELVKENALGGVEKMFVDIVKEMDWGNEVEKKLSRLNVVLSDDFVLKVLTELRTSPLKALKVFEWVGKSSSYRHNSVTYNGVLRVLGREESIADFWCTVEEMKSLGYEIDADTYIKISRRFHKCWMLKDMVELYERMMDGPFKPSEQQRGVLLRAIGGKRNPDLDLIFRVVNKYEGTGSSLSKSLYDGIHRALTNGGSFDEAEKIVEAMKESGYEPDNITYSQLIFGLCNARKLEEARGVLDVMEENGCVPDLKTWTILINGHCMANELDNAMLCFAKMMEKGCEIDGDLLDVLINGFLYQNRISGAYTFLIEMVNKVHLRPWQATYKNLITKLLGERKFEESLELLRLMKKHDYPPFSEPFLQYISKLGSVNDAQEFLKAFSFKAYPPVAAYQSIFQAFFHEGRHYEARDLLYKCPPHIRAHKSISFLFGSA